jgi:2-polyprenyl-3-methyl-5-hydroxy-6-metoxy-1,4-benzoquinol methylase
VQADDVLVCGCGNSELSGHMYDAGFTRITNVDSSRVVIDMMQDKYTQQEYPGMICEYRNLNIAI